MKRIALALAALAFAAAAHAQGTVNFSTRVGAVNAPVRDGGGNLVDGTVWGQLYAAAPGSALAPIGNRVPFRSDAGKGYITAGGTVEIPGVPAGGSAQVKLVSWYASQGSTYAEAVALGQGGYGESRVITISTGGGTTPPASMIGLEGFSLVVHMPEPSVAGLGLLGAGLLLIPRRRSHGQRRLAVGPTAL